MSEDQATNQQTKAGREEQPASDSQTPMQRPVINIDPARVPANLQFLIPCAQKWGIRDKELQQTLLRKASQAELEELYKVVQPAFDDINRFVMLHPSLDEPGSEEAGAFDALYRAALEASDILYEVLPRKQWFKLVGWPERFPGPKLDAAKFPAELHPIIPQAEKWVLDDDVIRGYVLAESTDEELKEFVYAVEQVGIETVRRVALEMVEDKTRYDEAIILMKMLELVEKAKFLLRTRNPSTTKK